jgi:hypothetical protein
VRCQSLRCASNVSGCAGGKVAAAPPAEPPKQPKPTLQQHCAAAGALVLGGPAAAVVPRSSLQIIELMGGEMIIQHGAQSHVWRAGTADLLLRHKALFAAGLPPPQFTKLPPGGRRSERLESLQKAAAQVRSALVACCKLLV